MKAAPAPTAAGTAAARAACGRAAAICSKVAWRASCPAPSAAVSSLIDACIGTREPTDTERRSRTERERR